MPNPTKTLLDADAHKAILKGVNSIYIPTAKTFGPEGKNALVYGTFGQEPRHTNCGNIISGIITPRDVHERLVAMSFYTTCKKTDEMVGDGRTLTAILGGKLTNDAFKLIGEEKGGVFEDNKDIKSKDTISAKKLKKQIIETAENVKKEIRKVSKKVESVEDVIDIATTSVEDDELGKIIGEMSYDVGPDSFIDVLDGVNDKIETERIKGSRFPAKIADKLFMNHKEAHRMIVDECPVIITNYKLDNVQQALSALRIFGAKYKKLIIIAHSFSTQVLQTLHNSQFSKDASGNFIPNGAQIFPVACPSLRTEQFEDVAVYCNANFINKKKGDKIEEFKLGDEGFLERLVVFGEQAKEDAWAVGGEGANIERLNQKEKESGFEDKEKRTKSLVEERIEILKGQLKEERKGKLWKNLLNRRIASLKSSIGIIRLNYPTKGERDFKQLKTQDAVNACKSALKNGYVKGGGVCLKEIADKLPDNNIMKNVLLEPYKLIQAKGKLKIADDIKDASDVPYYAVENSVSIVSNFIVEDIIIAEEEVLPPVYGNMSIAKAILEIAATDRQKKGLLKENEKEMWLDARGGFTQDEQSYEK